MYFLENTKEVLNIIPSLTYYTLNTQMNKTLLIYFQIMSQCNHIDNMLNETLNIAKGTYLNRNIPKLLSWSIFNLICYCGTKQPLRAKVALGSNVKCKSTFFYKAFSS